VPSFSEVDVVLARAGRARLIVRSYDGRFGSGGGESSPDPL